MPQNPMMVKAAAAEYRSALRELDQSRRNLWEALKSIAKERPRLPGEQPGRPKFVMAQWAYVSLHKPAVERYLSVLRVYAEWDPAARQEALRDYLQAGAAAQFLGLLDTSERYMIDGRRMAEEFCRRARLAWRNNPTGDTLTLLAMSLVEVKAVDAQDVPEALLAQRALDRYLSEGR